MKPKWASGRIYALTLCGILYFTLSLPALGAENPFEAKGGGSTQIEGLSSREGLIALDDLGISICATNYLAASQEEDGFVYLYTHKDGYLPYVIVGKYDFVNENVTEQFTEYMLGCTEDFALMEEEHGISLGDYTFDRVVYNYSCSGHTVRDERYFTTLGEVTYMFGGKEVPELSQFLPKDYIGSIAESLALLDEEGDLYSDHVDANHSLQKEPDFVRGREAGENTKSASDPSRQVETEHLEENPGEPPIEPAPPSKGKAFLEGAMDPKSGLNLEPPREALPQKAMGEGAEGPRTGEGGPLQEGKESPLAPAEEKGGQKHMEGEKSDEAALEGAEEGSMDGSAEDEQKSYSRSLDEAQPSILESIQFKEAAAPYQGIWQTFYDDFQLYLPTDWTQLFLSEVMKKNGIVYQAGDTTGKYETPAWVGVNYGPSGGVKTMEELYQTLKDYGYQIEGIVTVNGIECISYGMEEQNLRGLMFFLPDQPGNIMAVVAYNYSMNEETQKSILCSLRHLGQNVN